MKHTWSLKLHYGNSETYELSSDTTISSFIGKNEGWCYGSGQAPLKKLDK